MPPFIPYSWRDVPASNPGRGAFLNGRGLGNWRSINAIGNAGASSRGRSGRSSGSGRGQPNDLERLVAERAIEKKDGFNPLNAGGRALMGLLDALDTPRAAVAASFAAVADEASGEKVGFQDWLENTRNNITMAEATGLDQAVEGHGTAAKLGAAAVGLGADIAIDPLTFIGGGAAKVGEVAGEEAANAFLRPATKEFLGEAAVKGAEREGAKFATAAERAAAVEEQGNVAAARAAQKARKFRSNQMLSDVEREAIGAIPGTYAHVPGKMIGLDRVIQKINPERFVDAQHGGVAFKITDKELGLGKVAGKLRARVTQGKFGNAMADLFVKLPEMRKAVLFGEPEDAAKAILAVNKRNLGNLQTRVKDMEWGALWKDLSGRLKKAGIDGTDVRYAAAEQLGGDVAGPSMSRVLAQAAAKGDDKLAEDLKGFFPTLFDDANAIDPEHPWLMHRDDYTANVFSDEIKALMGNRSMGTGGKESFDMRQVYGLAPDQRSEFLGEKLLDPSEAGGRSVRQQQDDILKAHGLTDWFEKDAYKAFPTYIRRLAKRYGDEYMAKELRDLGIAEVGWVKQMSEAGYTQSKAKAHVVDMFTRAQARADKAELAAKDAQKAAEGAAERTKAAEGFVGRAAKERTGIEAEERTLTGMRDVGDSGAVREYEGMLREQSATLQVRRDALMRQVDEAGDELFTLDHASVEQAHSIKLETHRTYQRVTVLEQRQAELKHELEQVFDNLHQMDEAGPAAIGGVAVREMEQNQQRIVEITDEIHKIEGVLQQFEDLAATPTDQLEQQLARVDQQIESALEEHNLQPTADSARKLTSLSDVKSSILHEKGVIERARGRIEEVDRSHPELLMGEMDDLTNAQDMGDKLVHSLFPDLPDDINGVRIRSYMQDRVPELQQQIEDTVGQVTSAYADRDTMRVELAQIRAQRAEAQRNLRKVTKSATAEDRAIAAMQDDLLAKADEAAQNALEIDAKREAIEEQLGGVQSLKQDNDYAARIAEGHLSAMHARQLRYEAIAAKAEATAAGARSTQEVWRKLAKRQLDRPIEEVLVSALNDQYKALGAVSMTKDAWLVDGLRAATVMSGPQGIRPALRMYDKVLNTWKAYALATPGTILRNIFGGVHNNWLAGGVEAGDYGKTLAWLFGKSLGREDQRIFQQIADAGITMGAGTTLEIERRGLSGNLRPWSSDFAILKKFREGQENAEALLRGSLAYRTMKEGGTIEDAVNRVMKYHFDYDDISAFERSVMRRVVPFYTWTRKNFPLMLEQIMLKPQKFARFYQAKNNIELYSPEAKLVPSYFSENLSVRMPFGSGQGQAFVLPDLPFTSLNDVTDPSVMFSQVTPFIKTPIEYGFGQQVFKNIPLKDEYQPVPRFMEHVPGLFPALQTVGLAKRGANGNWYMKQKNMYVAEQMLPSFGKARRLFPSEERYNQRTLSSWLSFAFGIGLRTNTPNEIRNEAFRRVQRDLEKIDTQKELGFLHPGEDKLPRFGQTVHAAYERLGVAR